MAIKKPITEKGQTRSVVYVRYSDRKQDGSFSIEYQVEECARYMATRGYHHTKTYVDKAKSGKKVAGREEFDQMCRDAAKNKFEVIVVFSLSRSFRNVREALNFCHEMQTKHNIFIESVIEPLDMTSPHGKFSSTNLFAMHELQSDITANHVKAGMHIAAQQGYYLGGYVPFGYTTYGTGEWARGKEKRKYKPEETEQEIVKMIFELYAEGFSLTYIQDKMKQRKIKGRKGKIMGSQTIARILRNEFYIGTRRFDIEGYETLILPKSVPAIIDEKLWAVVQARHKRQKDKTKPRKNSKRLYELTGKIFCAKCNAHFSGEFKTDIRNPKYSAARYICSTKKSQRTCDAKNIRKEHLDEFVVSSIRKHILNEQAMDQIATHIAKIAGSSPTEVQAKIKALEKQKNKLVSMETELTRKELLGDISRETYQNLKGEITTEISDINLELLQLESTSETAITKESVLEYLQDMLDNIQMADPEILKSIFDKVVEKIIVEDDKVTLHLIVSPLSPPSSEHNETSGHPHYSLCSTEKRNVISKQ